MITIRSMIIACSTLIGSQFIATAAMAQASDGTYRGPVVVSKGMTLECTATVVLAGGASQATISLADGLCPLVSFNNTPYAVTWSGNNATIHNVNVTTITPGGCNGNLDVVWDGANTFSVSGTLPPDCSVNGSVSK